VEAHLYTVSLRSHQLVKLSDRMMVGIARGGQFFPLSIFLMLMIAGYLFEDISFL
jgi:hypothetical protein